MELCASAAIGWEEVCGGDLTRPRTGWLLHDACLGSVAGSRAARSSRQMGLDDQLHGPSGLPGLGAPGDRLIFQVYLLLNGGALGKLGVVPPDE